MTKKEFLHKVTARYRKNPILAKPLEWTGSAANDHQWIFIVGCYNSGTTLLDQILSNHTKISGLPDEGVMLTNQLVRPEDFHWRRMWWKCEKEMENYSLEHNIDAKTIRSHWSHFYDLKKPYLLEKSISNTCRIKYLGKNFKHTHFIHIVRNGYAVAEGIQRKTEVMQDNPFFREGKYPIDYCARQWVRSLEKVEEEKDAIDNFLEIRYEDLTADPAGTVNKILDFLNLEHMAEDFFENSFEVHEKKSEIINMNKRSFERLSEEDMEVISEVAGDYLKKYNYEILTK